MFEELNPRERNFTKYMEDLKHTTEKLSLTEHFINTQGNYINLTLPPHFFTINSLEEILRYVNILGLNQESVSKGKIEFTGYISKNEKKVLLENVAEQVLHSPHGDKFFYDISDLNSPTFRKRDMKLWLQNFDNNDFSKLLRDNLNSKLQNYGLVTQGKMVYGFEELKQRKISDFTDLKRYLDSPLSKKIHGFYFE